jgi:hypothetical protein
MELKCARLDVRWIIRVQAYAIDAALKAGAFLYVECNGSTLAFHE